MNKTLKYTTPALAMLGLVLGGCQPELDAPAGVSAGTADFSRYVAVGNSLTAGFSDGGLYRNGQLNSYPNILAGEFKQAGGGDFVQPLFTEAQANGSGYLRLDRIIPATATSPATPVTANVTTMLAIDGTKGTQGLYVPPRVNTPIPGVSYQPAPSFLYTEFTGTVQNLGVPGIRVSDINTRGYGSIAGNPYFERITPDANPFQTYRQRLAAANPTFFTYWLGNNDVLGYATAGGAASFLTPVDTFSVNTTKALTALTVNGAKGVVARIPDVTGIPFFTTVGPTLKARLTAGNVPGFVALTGNGNTRKTIATADIKGADGVGRQLLTLTSSPYLGLLGTVSTKYWRDLAVSRVRNPATGSFNRADYAIVLAGIYAGYQIDTTQAVGSPGNPFPSTLLLDDSEQTLIATATTAFNNALTTSANNRGLAIFDANAFFRSVAAGGYATNAVDNGAGFLSGNLFSLDGVHPTPRGYAVIANEMLKVINAKYGSTFRGVNANNYRGVAFPN